MNRISDYLAAEPSSNGHATPAGVAVGVPAAEWNGLPVQIVNEETIGAAMLYDNFPRVLEHNPEIEAGFRHQSALYLVTDADPDGGFAKLHLLVPRATMRKKSASFGEGFTVNVNGREMAVSSPVVMMTKAAWDKFRAAA